MNVITVKHKDVWVVLGANGNLVRWHTESEPTDEGFEIHRTKKLAKGAAFSDEIVVRATIAWKTVARVF